MTILSLDQSSRASGWALFVDKKLETFGKFITEDPNIDNRLVKIKNEIIQLIDTYSPNKVIIEDIQEQDNAANNMQTFKVLSEVYGVVSELLTELNIPHQSMPSSTWKSILKVKGKARAEQKKNAKKYAEDQYKISVTQDEADAICIGAAYLKDEESNKCAW